MDILDTLLMVPEEPALKRNWSPLQAACFEAQEATSDNLLIEAVAGSGKTTTVMEMVRRAFGSSIYLAFNREIADETRAKYPGVDCRTFHSFGNTLWRNNRPQARMEKRKTEIFLADAVGKDSPIFKEHSYTISRLIGMAKARGWGIGSFTPTALDFESLCDGDQIDLSSDMIPSVASVASTVYQRCIRDQSMFDFDDMLFSPIYFGWQFPSISNVFVDECQDLNTIQHLILQALADLGARIIAVGDRRQAIYAFRGALSDSMDLLKFRFDMKEFPLSVTYRCPLEVVKEAQLICPTIQPRADAPKGSVGWREIMDDGFGEGCTSDPELFALYNLVLCRNNAPLFRAVLRHVRARSACRVKSNFLDNFESFVRSFKETSCLGLLLKLDQWYEREREAAEAKGLKSKLEALADKYQTVKLLATEFEWTREVLDCVRDLQRSTIGPVFSTIHKAKGLEAPHVYLIRPDLIPAKFATSEEALLQEMNLKYVAITRAQETFTYGVPW